MSTAVDEKVDLSDLDMLDDARRHARCLRCQPKNLALGTPFIALCGVRAIHLSSAFRRRGDIHPPDACPECKALWEAPCRICGGTA